MNTIRFVLSEMLLSWATSLCPKGSLERISLTQARREHYKRVHEHVGEQLRDDLAQRLEASRAPSGK